MDIVISSWSLDSVMVKARSVGLNPALGATLPILITLPDMLYIIIYIQSNLSKSIDYGSDIKWSI